MPVPAQTCVYNTVILSPSTKGLTRGMGIQRKTLSEEKPSRKSGPSSHRQPERGLCFAAGKVPPSSYSRGADTTPE